MKIYDTISHRSFEIDPQSINISASRKKAYVLYLHESADKYKVPYATGQLFVNKNLWKKIITKPRKYW